jgi:hypothetical protein
VGVLSCATVVVILLSCVVTLLTLLSLCVTKNCIVLSCHTSAMRIKQPGRACAQPQEWTQHHSITARSNPGHHDLQFTLISAPT